MKEEVCVMSKESFPQTSFAWRFHAEACYQVWYEKAQ